jgi:phosphatidylinositol alpha-mannosyltransferase
MAAAVPIVASDNNGYQSVMEHESQGVLVPETDTQAVADALLELLRDPALRQRLGSAGRETALNRFSWDLVGDQIERFYLSLLDPQTLYDPDAFGDMPLAADANRERTSVLGD